MTVLRWLLWRGLRVDRRRKPRLTAVEQDIDATTRMARDAAARIRR